MVQGWTAKNTTINYEGVSVKKDWVTNGDLTSNGNGWTHIEVDTYYRLYGHPWVNWDGNPTGCLGIDMGQGSYAEGDTALYYQNISIPEELSSKMATLSFDYKYHWASSVPDDGNIYMAVIIDGVEKNNTIDMNSINFNQWTNVRMEYNPVTYGQVLPGDVTIKIGVYIDNDCSKDTADSQLLLDNIKLEFWTLPDETGILKALDVEFSQEYAYYNTMPGKGYSFIDVERIRSSTEEVIFTISEDIPENIIDFSIDTLTLHSPAIKIFNSTISGKSGVFYTLGEDIIWQMEFSISIPQDYNSWVEIEKPADWIFISIIDGFEVNRTENCLGKEQGSTRLIIPSSELGFGLWKFEAISKNYVEKGNIGVWDGFQFQNTTKLTHGDIFMVNITLDESLTLPDSRINYTIYFPNATILLHDSKEPISNNLNLGNFTVGNNMIVGTYIVKIEWVNNLRYTDIDKVGFIELEFIIWHHTNLSAVESYLEKIPGDPCLIKVSFTDVDFNETVQFATIKYNSTFGQSGTMVYLGSGVYFSEIDTTYLGFGDYYFSFNASKSYYQNQTSIDLIHLKVLAQPLALEVPETVISGFGNDYISCQINVTGAFTGALIHPANISTNWQNPYTVTNHNNGTFTLNFSTWELPTQGIIETFTVSVLASKPYYGNTTGFIAMTVYPIQTNIGANKSIFVADLGESIDIKVNYTMEGSEFLIFGANCSVSWPSISNITLDAQGFVVSVDTVNLSIDTYTAIIKLEKPGFETAYKSITVIINRIDIEVNTIDFQDSLEAFFGETILIRFNLTESGTDILIENASIFYSWEFGLGYFDHVANGTYELELKLPETVEGNYKMTLIILKEDSIYKSKEFSFIMSIRAREQPNYVIWYIILGLIIVASILGALSLRSYVFLPLKRKKESDLLAKTQRYKDIMNIEALVVSNRVSGLELYSKSYYFFQEHQNQLLSGFIQAITLVSNEIVGKEKIERFAIGPQHPKGIEKIVELDFKHFNFFICDYRDIRLIFILKEKASERFKKQTAKLLLDIDLHFSDQFTNWDGDLGKFSKFLPPLLDQYFQLYYKDQFKLNNSIDINRIKKEAQLSKKESKLLKALISMTKSTEEFYLENLIEEIHEKNKDEVIKVLELLIDKGIVISSTK